MSRLRTAIAILCCLLLTAASLSAQAQQGECLPVPGQGTGSVQNWHHLIDESGQLTLEEVLSQRNLFQRLEQPAYASLGGDSAVWLQVLLPGCGKPLWLWLSAPRVEYLDFYLLRNGQLQQPILSGERRPLSNRPLPARAYLFSLPNDQQPREAYIRLQSSHPLVAHFRIIDETGLVDREKPAYLHGALLGALALLGLYNLLRFFQSRHGTYGWLGMLHIFLSVSAAANLGLLAVWVPWLGFGQALIADLSALLATLALLILTLAFLGYPRQAPGDWLLWGALVLIGCVAVTLVSQLFWHSLLVHAVALFGILAALAAALHHWRQGYRPARTLSAALLGFGAGAAFFLAILTGLVPYEPGTAIALMFWTTAVNGLILNIALNERERQQQADSQSQHTAEAVSSAEQKTKSDFLARLSHDIRAPLNGVLGMTELLLSTSLSAKQRDYVQTIHSSGNELLGLINEILDIPKLESGQIELDDVRFDLHALINDCLDSFRNRAEQQGIELISLIHPEVARIVSGDPTRLRQILLSLLDHAFRQTEEGEILLLAANEGTPDAPRLRITVQDSGRPLDRSEREALLGATLDSRDFLATTPLGAQVGLLVARQLVRLMKGELGVQSGRTQGNTVWIMLPLPGHTQAEDNADVLASLQGVRLLIVDDNETCRKVLQQQCGNWGMEVALAATGKEALALLRTKAHLREYFDVVLLDQEMPGMSGLQLAMKIKEDLTLNQDILLIMLTGLSRAPSKVVARNAGIKRILAKPVAGYTLRTTLADELARRPREPFMPRALPGQGTPLPAPPAGFRILVAEDDKTSTKVMAGMLRKLGLEPDFVSNGEEALQAIEQQPYDLVLMDCEMPLLDGFSATRRLREWENTHGRPRTPVVALTAHVFSEHRERAREAGMDGHMAKPVELSQLRELIRHWADVKASAGPH